MDNAKSRFPLERLSKWLINNKISHIFSSPADTYVSQSYSKDRMQHTEIKCIPMRDYLPARLVRAKDRWYFSYYQTNPATGIRERHRESFDIGRIPINQRLPLARQIVESINSQLPFGYPFNHDLYSRAITMKVKEALDLVRSIDHGLRHASVLSYRYSIKKFETFIVSVALINEDISTINKKVAMAYSDYLIRSGLSGRSHNNDINEMRRAFNLLKARDIVTSNPFDAVPKRRVEEKARRCLSINEARAIFSYTAEVDKSVHLSCALLYFCLIRPKEQSQLQRKDIDLVSHLIRIKGTISKNRKSQSVTIPVQLVDIMINLGLDQLPPDYYIMGSAEKIGKPTAVGKSSISNRYRDILIDMRKKNLLNDEPGNVLYSWKDTGVQALKFAGIDVFTLKDQGRWHSLSQAQSYLTDIDAANEFIKNHHRL